MPSFGELRQFGHLRGIALGHPLLDPFGDGRNLLIGQTALIGEFTEAVRGVPGGHIAGFRHADNQRSALPDVFIRNERERSRLTRAMAGHAVPVHDRRDIFAEGDLVGSRKQRGRREQDRELCSHPNLLNRRAGLKPAQPLRAHIVRGKKGTERSIFIKDCSVPFFRSLLTPRRTSVRQPSSAAKAPRS
jgi:hypothetical protein